jgi:hypothetical protein
MMRKKRKRRMPAMEEMPLHPLLSCHHLLHPHAAVPEEINDEGHVEMIPE